MADYPISNVPRRVQYVNSGVGPYAFTFEILVQTDIAVYRGDTLLTLTTDYTVTINANGTGSITLTTAGTGNITIVGARAIQRSSDYTTGGDLFASTLNTDLDSQTIYSQQLAENIDRTITVPITDASTLDMQLPVSTSRANKLFGFSNSGQPTVSSTTVAQLDAAVSSFVNTTGNNASSILYTPGGSGAVQTNVQTKLRESISIKDFGAVGNNVADDTLAIQAAYDSVGSTGATIFWPNGTYKTSVTIKVKSNTTTIFSSGAAIDPVALADFQVINFPTYAWGYALFINENFTTSTFDVNITYINVRMIPSRKDFTWSQGVSWNGHGIDARNVQNLKILNSYGENLADFCGILHCNEVLVQGNWCVGMSNSAYDFWEGCQRVRLINNVAKTANNSTNWNAVDTQNLGSFNANNFLCEGNHFEGGPGAAIFVSPLNATSTCTNVKIVNNTIDQLNLTTPDNPNGIVIQATSNCIVSNNTIRRIGAGFSPIFVGADGFGVLSNNVSICDNVIVDSALVSNSYIAAFGTNHYISGNQDVNSSATGAAYIQVDSPTSIIMPQQFTGTVVNAVNNATNLGVPTTPAFEFRALASQSQWYARQGIRTDDGFASGTEYGITAIGNNLATAYAITKPYTYISSAAASTGVALPAANATNIGKEFLIFNQGGNTVTVYAQSGDTINGGASITVNTSAKVRVVCLSTNVYQVSGT